VSIIVAIRESNEKLRDETAKLNDDPPQPQDRSISPSHPVRVLHQLLRSQLYAGKKAVDGCYAGVLRCSAETGKNAIALPPALNNWPAPAVSIYPNANLRMRAVHCKLRMPKSLFAHELG